MINISEAELKELISSLFNIDVKIKKLNYYLIGSSTTEFKLISYSKNEIDVKIDQLYSIGIPIIEKIKSQFNLLPGILSCIQDLPVIKVNRDDALKISYNRSIKNSSSNGLHLIVDESDRKISMGEVLNGAFTPVVDLGYYLRSER
jgi:hypothetical protein